MSKQRQLTGLSLIITLMMITLLASGCTQSVTRSARDKLPDSLGTAGKPSTVSPATNKTNQGKKAAEATVMNYNLKLAETLQHQDMSRIKSLITQKQYSELQLYLAYLTEKLQVTELDSLLDQQVKNVEITASGATVKTHEVWRVKQRNRSTGKLSDFGEIFYQNTYLLVMNKGHWLVDTVEAVELSVKNAGKNSKGKAGRR